MTANEKKMLTTALRIIATNGKTELITIDTDIRPHFQSAAQQGKGLVETAIEVVIDAIERASAT